MNEQVRKLYEIAGRDRRRIIGLMSGTSLDGLDVALCEFAGSGLSTRVTLERFATIPYPEAFRASVREVFAKKKIDFQHLCLLNPIIGRYHGQIVLDCLKSWGVAAEEVDVIASHGQTVFHAPQSQHGLSGYPNGTLQIGDGDHLAVTTGILTLSDFRQKHVAAGGEGAPLAVYGDYLLFGSEKENRILLNMGGIANFTWLPAKAEIADVFTTDTGPGNTIIDNLVLNHFGDPFDRDGQLAAVGRVNYNLLKALKNNRFFHADFPKTTGPEVFNLEMIGRTIVEIGIADPSPHDLIATMTRFSAETIAEAILRIAPSGGNNVIYASGGGAHNPVLMHHIAGLMPAFPIRKLADLGLEGDAKEAVLFAVLANETLAGKGFPNSSKNKIPSVTMGKISFPG